MLPPSPSRLKFLVFNKIGRIFAQIRLNKGVMGKFVCRKELRAMVRSGEVLGRITESVGRDIKASKTAISY